MSASQPSPPPPPTNSAPPEGEALIRLLRTELINTQLIVLDLNDRVLEKETDKADALSILGRVELMLEQKLNEISALEVHHVHEIGSLRAQLEELLQARSVQDAAIRSLSADLAGANKTAAAHGELAETRMRELADVRSELARVSEKLSATSRELAESAGELVAANGKLATISRSVWWRIGKPWRALFGPKL